MKALAILLPFSSWKEVIQTIASKKGKSEGKLLSRKTCMSHLTETVNLDRLMVNDLGYIIA
jgi:hypothetical protein